MHIHQLSNVVGIAQAVRAIEPLVADQAVVHQHALDALEQAQRLKGQRAALGVRGQPGQGGRDGAVQPVQLTLDADAALVCVHDRGALHALRYGCHRRAQGVRGVLRKALDAGLG